MNKSKTSRSLPTKQSTGFLVRSLHQSFNKLLAQRISHANLTTAQWFFLRALWEMDGVAQRELSNSVGLTESTTVAALKILEKNRLVKRKRDRIDSRRILVNLTKKGRELEKELLPGVLEINRIVHKGSSTKEIKALQKQLCQLRARLDEEVSRNI
ncbi:MAG: DNA-binding MarR family transcriptional regulator [Gammaproteobacteria bacterium]|jgi:DNA-binding MarR family transcriptional regulator